ncbi:MAG TPA: LamG-like jellyroll fold domain-containing protein, partial [Verrucomicrobiae bacterium]|nr:LamG-like jellyroll fold domain-containing protein [Verrucomicrobiae bacterium]
VLDSHSYPNPSCPASVSQAVVNGEFGGVGLGITNHTWASGWGYVSAKDGDDLATQFEGFCSQLSGFVQNQGLSAAVYTQITDVETELNGLCTYDRKERKPDARRLQTAIAGAGLPPNEIVVLPTSQTNAQTWRYTTNAPPQNWYATDFDDSTWKTGSAGFGAGNPPNTAGLVRTAWNSGDIWLRRTFNPGGLTSQQLTNLAFLVYHDEDVEVYLNGVLAATASGYTVSYVPLPVGAAGQAVLRTNATNELAVHCHQTAGGQYIDVGLVASSNIVLSLPPLPESPQQLSVVAGPLGVSLGWPSVANATAYVLKRSSHSGGPYTNSVLTTPVNAATDATVTNDTTYYYVVSAVNAAGQSADSAEVKITTAPAPPQPVPKLVAWFKADALAGVADGSPVSKWPDASGNTNDASQVNLSQRPVYASKALNDLPVIRFSGTNSSFLAFTRPVQDDFTIVCVFQSTQGVGTGTQFYQGAGLVNGEVPNVVNDFGTSLNANGQILAGTGNPDVTLASAPGFNDGQPHVVTFSRVRATGALSLFVDGVLQGMTVGSKLSLTAPPRLVIGAQQTELNFLNGDIAEALVYDAALSDADRATVEGSLECKYGFGDGSLPPAPLDLNATVSGDGVLLTWRAQPGVSAYVLGSSTNRAGPFQLVSAEIMGTNYTDSSPLAGRTNYYVIAAANTCGTGQVSAAVSVYIPPPALGARLGAGSVLLSWPAAAGDWTLVSATNLNLPVVWLPMTNPPSSSNGMLRVVVPLDSGTVFFRLLSR